MIGCAGRGSPLPPIIAKMGRACTRGRSADRSAKDQLTDTLCAASRVAAKRTSGARSCASCRLTRVGARYTSWPAASMLRLPAFYSRNSSSFFSLLQVTQRAVVTLTGSKVASTPYSSFRR